MGMLRKFKNKGLFWYSPKLFKTFSILVFYSRGVGMKRPLDALNKARGKNVLVVLKNGKQITGTLQALDIHLNLWLDNAELQDDDKVIKLNTLLIRGDSIVYVSAE